MLITSARKEKPQLRAESLHFAHQSGVARRLAPHQPLPPPSKKTEVFSISPLYFLPISPPNDVIGSSG